MKETAKCLETAVSPDSSFTNLSGQFCPKLSPIGERWDRRGWKKTDGTFWTSELVDQASCIVAALSKELAEYGVSECKFEAKQVFLLGNGDLKDGTSGISLPFSGHIGIGESTKEDLDAFALNYGHEFGHTLEARILYKGRMRRDGLVFYLKNVNRKKIEESQTLIRRLLLNRVDIFLDRQDGLKAFSKISEAVVERTTLRIIAKHLPKVLIVYNQCEKYNAYIGFVESICNYIAQNNPCDYKDSEDVYKLFEQAQFGRGKALPLARAIEKTYGEGSFSKILFAIEALPKFPQGEQAPYVPLVGFAGVLAQYRLVHAVLRGERSIEEFGTI
jgi:hypothetical protein